MTKELTDTLIDVYHDIYDVKDANYDNEVVRVKAYHALQGLASFMECVNVPVPERFDKPPIKMPRAFRQADQDGRRGWDVT